MPWPQLDQSWCPWCGRFIARPRLTRLHDGGAEYACHHCGRRHVRKEGVDDAVFVFFPADVYAAFAGNGVGDKG
jgi:hypothetical protein